LTAVLDPVIPGLDDAGPRQIDPATAAPLLPQVGCAYAGGRRVMSTREAALPAARGTSPATVASAGPIEAPVRVSGGLEVGPAKLDQRGKLVGLGGMDVVGPLTTIWRAPTDNDEGHGPVDYWHVPPTGANRGAGAGTPGPSSADRWREARLHLLSERHVSTTVTDGGEAPGGGVVVVRTRCSAPEMAWALDVTTTLAAASGGVRLRTEIVPTGNLPAVLPRLGVRLGLPPQLTRATWCGTGPAPAYTDLTGALRHGAFTGDVDSLWQQPVRPQEGGSRPELRHLRLTGADGAGPRLDVVIPATCPLTFSLSPWSLENLTAAEHAEELAVDSHLWLHLDALHHGIGSRSCGPDVRPEAAAAPRPVVIQAWLGVAAG
ncbi:hypothetical protein RWX45_06510, partial [Actinomyces sp. MRS3W]|nr:hypothetical protein [Actinomyces sp. MRS3W]MDU0348473.1 hypothetical protein [Actinomyces sp. MRS3W]